jgi:hypothetical protein
MARTPLPGIAILVLLSSLSWGCPKGSATRKAPEPCKQFGQQCELEPGKLGACAYKTDCTAGADCLYCQSQH